MKSKELRQKRALIVEEMTELVKKGHEEWTPEDREKFDKIDADVVALTADIERVEKLERMQKEQETATTPNPPAPNEEAREEEERKAYSGAFENYIRHGFSGMAPEERSLIRGRVAPYAGAEGRALTVTTTAGGYLIPEGFSGALEKNLLAFGGMREAARIVRTASGNDLPWPTVDDTGNVGELLAINTAAAEQDVAFGQVVFNAYKYSSKIVLVPIELLQDSAFDVNALIADLFAERVARITNTHFTTGDGSSKPNGVVTAASQGAVGATGQTTTIIFEDLVELEHSIDPAYRRRGACRWMMSDAALKMVKKLKDDNGQPLWTAGIQSGEPNMIYGYPYTINQDIAVPAASAKSILYGDFSKYIIREVMDFSLLRLAERYAEYAQVGFVGFARYDGDLLDAGTKPIKWYEHPAT
jgi:HK97 family phage major capsid protein